MKKEHTHAQSSRLPSIFFILVMLEESRLVTVCIWVRDGCQRKSRSKGKFKDVSKNTDLSWNKKLGVEFEGHVKTVKRLEVSVINVQ